jgi:hypothetical protein
MTPNFRWLHGSAWLAHAQLSRAMTLVLGVIGISLLFSALRVVDGALSGALVEPRPAAASPAAMGASTAADRLLGTDPAGATAVPVGASLVDVPEATADAISL